MSVATELTAGGIAGATAILATQPLDTIRIRLQNPVLGYAGILNCIGTTVRDEGIRGLYKGYASPVMTVGAFNAVLFFSYGSACDAFRKVRSDKCSGELSIPYIYAAGAASGIAISFISGPTELVKCIAQTNLKNHGKIYDEYLICRQLVRDHRWGPHGLRRGLLATIIRDTPSSGLYFAVYEGICRKFGKSGTVSFCAGGIAGSLAWASVYPLDVIKTRWQIATPGTYTSLRHCFKATVQREGFGVFRHGFGATMIRAFPQNAVVFYTYGLVSDALR